MNQPGSSSRFIPIDGSINFRDFGGYRTADGSTVRSGLLFRSGTLSMITARGIETFAGLDIGVICDLRRVDEAERGPAPNHPTFAARTHIPIAPGSNEMLRLSLANSTHGERDRTEIMIQMMRDLARDCADEYRRLFTSLLQTDRGFLLHCSAGKDRTGFGAMLILSALGVDEATIRQDYLLTNQAECLRGFMGVRMREIHKELDDGSLEAITGVRDEYFATAIHELRQCHGSVDHYLSSIGVGHPEREALRARLLT